LKANFETRFSLDRRKGWVTRRFQAVGHNWIRFVQPRQSVMMAPEASALAYGVSSNEPESFISDDAFWLSDPVPFEPFPAVPSAAARAVVVVVVVVVVVFVVVVVVVLRDDALTPPPPPTPTPPVLTLPTPPPPAPLPPPRLLAVDGVVPRHRRGACGCLAWPVVRYGGGGGLGGREGEESLCQIRSEVRDGIKRLWRVCLGV
jgi:hypothetical protein